MIPLYLFIALTVSSFGLIVYSLWDHNNRLYANIVAMFIAGILLAYLGTVISTNTVYDAWYCTYNTSVLTHSCTEIPFNSPGAGYALGFISFVSFCYVLYMGWDAINDYRSFKAGEKRQ